MAEIYAFTEKDVSVSGPAEELLELASWLDGTTQSTELCKKWKDIAYTIRLHLDEGFHKEVST